jgi:hypothetical protein
MGAVTHPHPDVVEFVSQHFVAAKLNGKEPAPDFNQALGRGKFFWGPLYVFLDSRGIELRRYLGFLPPDEFLADLRLVLGMEALIHSKPEKALEWFTSVTDRYPGSAASPEALYLAGSAAYKASGSLNPLIEIWDRLIAEHPESTWAKRADVIPDDLRTGS